MKLLLALLVLVAAVNAADPPEVATGVPAEPSYTRFSLEEDLAKEMSTIAPADVPSEPSSISISELHANHNMDSSPTPAAEPEPTTKQTFIMKITTKSPMMQALMNETMDEHTEGMKVEEMVPKPASVKPVEGAHEMKPMGEMKPVESMKPMETMKPVMTDKPHEMMENKTMVTPKPMKPMMGEHDDDEHYQNDSPMLSPHEPEPQPEPEPEHEEEKKTPKPVAPTQKPQPTPSSKDKTSASSQLVSNTTKSHSAASSLSPSVILATVTMALLTRLAC